MVSMQGYSRALLPLLFLQTILNHLIEVPSPQEKLGTTKVNSLEPQHAHT